MWSQGILQSCQCLPFSWLLLKGLFPWCDCNTELTKEVRPSGLVRMVHIVGCIYTNTGNLNFACGFLPHPCTTHWSPLKTIHTQQECTLAYIRIYGVITHTTCYNHRQMRWLLMCEFSCEDGQGHPVIRVMLLMVLEGRLLMKVVMTSLKLTFTIITFTKVTDHCA